MWSAIIAAATWLFKLIFGSKSVQMREAEGLGEATQQVADLKTEVKAQSAVANAEANAPSTVAGVEDRLSKGTF